MNHEVESDGNAMAFEPFQDAKFLRVGFGAGDFVGSFFAGTLKAQLKVIEAGFDKSFETRFIERQAGGDEIDVEAGCARGANEIENVWASEGFAASEIGLKNAECGGFAEDAGPVFGGEFCGAGLEFERIRAVDAVERAAV